MTIEERLAALESAVAALKANQPQPPAGDDLVAKFADDVVKKTPKQYVGAPFDGKRFADLTAAEANALAGYHEWLAKKGREETPVRLNNAGKPWHERDALIARVLRAMASKASIPEF